MSIHVRERLGEYLDGEIATEERSAISRHLRECPDCRRLLEEMSAVDDAARSLPAEAPEGYFETFASRVRARLHVAPRRGFRPPVWSLAVAAALLLAVITPLTLKEHPAPAAPSVAERVAEPPALRDLRPSPDAPPVGQAVPRTRPPAGGGPAGVFASPPSRSGAALQERKDASRNAAPAAPEPEAARAPAPAPAKAQAAAAPETAKRKAPTAGVATFYCDGCDASPSPHLAARENAEELDATSVSTSSEAKPRALAKGRLVPGVVGGTAGTDRLAAAGEARYRMLRARTPASAEEARELRREWRAFAESALGAAHADDARVAAIEAAVEAYRFSASPEDRATATADARTYLARSDAPQAERVRTLLDTLSDAP